MQFIIIDADIPNWIGYYLLALFLGPTLLPIIAGFLCGFMDWISPLFGFASGLGSAVGGCILGFFFAGDVTDYLFPDPETAIAAFGILAALIAIQVLLVAGFCLLVNWRRNRSWGIRRW